MKNEQEYIEIYGAREHNLCDINLKIPREQLVVITGISGSGKSSLAFDTIYAEGQRRYMETFSAYARSFIGNMERPDVDKIEGLSPVISIEQKTTSRNIRSTVGTTTEIYDFLRLLYARTAIAYSYVTNEPMIKMSESQILRQIIEKFNEQKLIILAPIVKGRKGHYRELFQQIRKQGFVKARIDGEIRDLLPKMQLDRYVTHDIEIVIDRIIAREEDLHRIAQSIQTAFKHGKGTLVIHAPDSNEDKFYSKHLMCPTSGIAYDDPAPNMFSFNSPYGACSNCKGLGTIEEITEQAIIPSQERTIFKGAIAPLGDYRNIWIFKQIEAILKKFKVSTSTKVKDIPREAMDIILKGSNQTFKDDSKNGTGVYFEFEGIIPYLKKQLLSESDNIRNWVKEYTQSITCPECEGARIKKESRYFLLDGKSIDQLASLDISLLGEWFEGLESRLNESQNQIAAELLKELRKRIQFLMDVGLNYLTLNRPLRSLSGGESQRIRLATQIGTQLVGVLYIMDEPSIGLHQRDNARLISALKDLKALGNSVLIVEHDKDMMLESDYLIDIGPGAGKHGGKIVEQGTPKEILAGNSTTAQYLNNSRTIAIPKERRKGHGTFLELKGAVGNNLKNVNLKLPLGKMICITGVSGSGKSSLIHETLVPILKKNFYDSRKEPMPYDSIEGMKELDKVIEIDQSPIGRTPRSNPATYTGVFSDIRTLYALLPEAKIRGYKVGRFSFNVKGGRCETCKGGGMRVIEMNFLPDVHVPCETCKGRRYNRETLEVRYKGKSINDVLEMTVEEAVKFFESHPKIIRKINMLNEVGLGYITLGQQATTLSGGEAQRVKLATELSKKDTGKTIYILDEPTTGLHFQDIENLLDILHKLTDKGNTVVIIEHNLDVVKVADHIIDIGPEGGSAGGTIIAEGTPEKVIKSKKSITGKFLKTELNA